MDISNSVFGRGQGYSSTPDRARLKCQCVLKCSLSRRLVVAHKKENRLKCRGRDPATLFVPILHPRKYCFRSSQIMTLFNFGNFGAYQIIVARKWDHIYLGHIFCDSSTSIHLSWQWTRGDKIIVIFDVNFLYSP